MTDAVATDPGHFAKIPEWLLFHPAVSSDAVRVFGIMLRHPAPIRPSRGRIADLAHCSVRTVDKAINELVSVGAMSIQHRFTDSGGSLPNEYLLHPYPHAESAPHPMQIVQGEGAENAIGGGAENDTQVRVSTESTKKTPTSSSAKAKKPRERSPLFDAISECWHPGIDTSALTASEASYIGKMAAEVKAVGGTPEQVPKAWAAWPRLYPKAGGCTPAVLAKYWNELIKLNGNGTHADESRYRKVETPDGPVYYDR